MLKELNETLVLRNRRFAQKNPRFVGSNTPAQAVLTARAAYPASTLADLYDPLSMPASLAAAHAALDRAVDRAYAVASGLKGSAPFPTDRARVEHLFALYERLTAPLLPAAKKARKKRGD